MITIEKQNKRIELSKMFKSYMESYERYENSAYFQQSNLMNLIYGYEDFDNECQAIYEKYMGKGIGSKRKVMHTIDDWGDRHQLLLDFQNGGKSSSTSKRGKRGKKKCSKNKVKKCGKVFMDEEVNGLLHSDISDDSLFPVEGDDKMIIFYHNIHDENNKEIFYDVYSFDEFCNEHNIEVSEYDCQCIMSNDISHCTINPLCKTIDGKNMLVRDSSYGGLRWLCVENEDELIDSYSSTLN